MEFSSAVCWYPPLTQIVYGVEMVRCGAVQCGVAERIGDLLHGKMDKAEAALTLTLPSKERYSS